jgi:hypothetical protein
MTGRRIAPTWWKCSTRPLLACDCRKAGFLRVRPVGEAAEEVERLAVVRMPAAGEERGAPRGERDATLQPTVYTTEFTWARRAVERSTTAERR